MQTCETEGHVKEVNSHKKYIKEKDKEIFKLQVKNENLELNMKRLKYEISDIRDKNKMLMKEKRKKELSPELHSSKTTINNNTLSSSSSKPLPSSFSTPCASVAPTLTPRETPSSPLNLSFHATSPTPAQPSSTPPQSLGPPSPIQAGPGSPRTPPGFPTCSHDTPFDTTDSMVADKTKTIITVQAKLKEVRDGGTKLDFESLVALLKNHPWENSQEQLVNDSEYEEFDFKSYPGDYEEDTIEEENDEPVEN